MLEWTSSLQFAAGQRTNGDGIWERIGKGAYRAVLEAFFNSSGTVLLSGCARASGVRFE